MRDRLLNRLYSAVVAFDIGVSGQSLSTDFLRGVNRALSRAGSPRLSSLDDVSGLRRAVFAIESAVDDDVLGSV